MTDDYQIEGVVPNWNELKKLKAKGAPMTEPIRMKEAKNFTWEFPPNVLPLEVGTEDAKSGIGWYVKDQEGAVIVDNSTLKRCSAIAYAVNTHDSLVDRLKEKDELLGRALDWIRVMTTEPNRTALYNRLVQDIQSHLEKER